MYTEIGQRQRSKMSVLTYLIAWRTAREHLKCKAYQNILPESQNNLLPKSFHLFCQIIPAHRQAIEINSNSDATNSLLSLSSETVPGPWRTIITYSLGDRTSQITIKIYIF